MLLTGTKNSTPVTMDVNAVPPILREYIFPSTPTAKAPMADTTSDRLKMKRFAPLFAAYETHEMVTMMTSSSDQIGWRLASEDKKEKTGTMMNSIHHGNGCSHHGKSGGR